MLLIKQKFVLNDEISQQDFDAVEEARKALFESEPCALLLSDETEADIDLVRKTATTIKSNFKNIIIIGTGASESIPKALFDLGNSDLNVIFLSNVDQYCVDRALKGVDKSGTCVLSISKSGNTIETVALTEYVIDWMKGEVDSIASRFFFITEIKDSNLLKIAQKIEGTLIRHANIGGRFSFFTSLGFISAALAGFDMDKIISKVHEIFPELISSQSWVMKGAAYNLSMNRKFSNNIFMTYGDRFEGMNLWMRQLVAESLGKDSKGINHIFSRGVVDHHSQLQLYLDGPKDKFFTAFFLEQDSKTRFSKIFDRQMRIAMNALETKKRNLRIISVKEASEDFISEFFMGVMLEVIIFAYVENIDPFSQPAVEELKAKSTLEV